MEKSFLKRKSRRSNMAEKSASQQSKGFEKLEKSELKRIEISQLPKEIPDFKNTFEKLSHQSYYYSYQLPSLISQATLESYIKSSLYKKQTQQLH